MGIGILYALGAGLLWGLVFVGPLIVPDYPAALQSAGRYVAFGLVALPLAWHDRARLRGLHASDWIEATRLTLVGNLLYYFCLASAIQRTGAPVSTMIIGTLPVVIAISSNLRDHRRDGRLPWLRLLPSLYSGGFVRHPAIERFRASEVVVDGDGLIGSGDGELLGDVPFTVTSAPGALRVCG